MAHCIGNQLSESGRHFKPAPINNLVTIRPAEVLLVGGTHTLHYSLGIPHVVALHQYLRHGWGQGSNDQCVDCVVPPVESRFSCLAPQSQLVP